MKNYKKLDSNTLPSYIVWGVAIISLAPLLLNLMGIDFASPADSLAHQSPTELLDHKFAILNGAFTHALLEWAAFTIAIVTCIMAFTTYVIKREVATPVIGVALLCAGSMDAFHTLAATRLIDAVASNENLIPFTWAICRLFNSLICLIGVSYFLFFDELKEVKRRKGLKTILSFSIFFLAISYAVIHICATSETLPQTQFPNMLITRPWDIYPFVVYFFSTFVFYKFYKKYPTPFTHALVISTIPDLAVQLYMSFGSSALFDNYFNIAHFLKIIAYLVPLLGLIFDYLETHRKVKVNERAKTDFLASMSHELRTPMNAIIGFSTICMNENDLNISKLNAKYIKQSGEELLTLINDILDFSSIEAKSLKLSIQTISLDHIIRSTIRSVESLSKDKSVVISFNFQKDIPLVVEGDPIRIKQILLNLISNAMKFTSRGTIQVKLNAVLLETGFYEYHFQVQDSGIGISKEQQKFLFERFTQVESSLSRSYGGAGLGLAISKELCEMMNGLLWVESDIGTGANFQFKLPLKKSVVGIQSSPLESEDVAFDGTDLKVLVAEDNQINRVLAKQLFEKINIQIDIALNGEEAVNMAKNKEYDFIFMDMQMPLLNGVDAAKEILLTNKSEHLPNIIAITANAFEEDRRQCLDVGMVDFLEKPLILNKIKLSLLKHKNETSQKQKANILIVEDNQVNQLLVISIFEKFNIPFDLAENGQKAVEMAEKVKYDLILMDIQMPIMDGLQATKEILSTRSETNVVAMTANTLPEDKQNCKDVGMVDYIGKPIDTDHLTNVLRQYAGAVISLKTHDTSENDTASFTYKLIDQKTLLQDFKGMEDVLVNVVKIYLKSCDETLATIKNSIDNSDIEKLRISAHSFKGIVANFKSDSVVALASELEKSCDDISVSFLSYTFDELYKQTKGLNIELENLCKELEP